MAASAARAAANTASAAGTSTLFPRMLAPLVLEGTGHTLRNRVLMGSMHTGMEEGSGGPHLFGHPDLSELAEFFKVRAEGGVGIIVTGGVAPNLAGRVAPFAAQMSSSGEAAAHKVITDAVHSVRLDDLPETKIAMQILHAGRYAYHPFAVAPSKSRAPIGMFTARELSTSQVQQTVRDYANSAAFAREAGYDGVEIMGSEGYLINEFIAARVNHREDEYGGSYENRIRFPLEIVRAVREKCGPDFIVIFRLSMLDLVEGGSDWEEIAALAARLEEAGASIINTGIGWHEARVPTIATCVPRAAFAPVTGKLRAMAREGGEGLKLSIPLVATNRINTPEVAEEVLASGQADMVSMARPFLADPHLVRKAMEGRSEDVNPCIACNQACLDHTFVMKRASCLVNPVAGYESSLGKELETPALAGEAMNVAVVGSGPAGLSFAASAAGRGHKVTVYEAADRIGGQFNMAKRVPGKEEFVGTLRYFDRRLEQLGVDVKLNTRVAAEDLASEGHDAVVLCTGVTPRVPKIPGGTPTAPGEAGALAAKKGNKAGPAVLTYWDVLEGGREPEVGDRVAIIGAGGIGFDVSEFVHHLPAPGTPAAAPTDDRLADGINTDEMSPSLNVESFWNKWAIDPAARGGMFHDQQKGGVAGGDEGSKAKQAHAHSHYEREIFLLQRKGGKLGAGLGRTTGWIHRDSVKKMDVVPIGNVTYDKIDEEGLHITIGEGKGKKKRKEGSGAGGKAMGPGKHTLDVDTVIICAGQEPLRELYDPLREQNPSLPVFMIGGAYEAGELDAKRAIDQGARLAAKLEREVATGAAGRDAMMSMVGDLAVPPGLEERLAKMALGKA